MSEQKQYVMIVLKQSWLASTWSDVQTFGIMCTAFGINSLYLNDNSWLNASLFFAFFLWAISKSIARSKGSTLQTTDIEEAIQFLKK